MPDLEIAFNGRLVAMEVASALAEAMPATFIGIASSSTEKPGAFGRSTAQGFEVTFAGLGAGTYLIELSPDLLRWTPLSKQDTVDGSATFTDAHSAGVSTRFYRARRADSLERAD